MSDLPVSLLGEHRKENIIKLEKSKHLKLHNTQNLKSKHIRSFRKKTNGILVPDDKFFALKLALWQKFFKNASIELDLQLDSLNRQIQVDENIEAADIDKALILLIDIQRDKVYNIINNYGKKFDTRYC